jgi:hypothetical protein
MKTAVEWLLEELPKVYVEHRHLVIEQANKMEKQQIIDAFNLGQQKEAKQEFWTKGEQYYNQNFTKASNDLNNNQNS